MYHVVYLVQQYNTPKCVEYKYITWDSNHAMLGVYILHIPCYNFPYIRNKGYQHVDQTLQPIIHLSVIVINLVLICITTIEPCKCKPYTLLLSANT